MKQNFQTQLNEVKARLAKLPTFKTVLKGLKTTEEGFVKRPRPQYSAFFLSYAFWPDKIDKQQCFGGIDSRHMPVFLNNSTNIYKREKYRSFKIFKWGSDKTKYMQFLVTDKQENVGYIYKKPYTLNRVPGFISISVLGKRVTSIEFEYSSPRDYDLHIYPYLLRFDLEGEDINTNDIIKQLIKHGKNEFDKLFNYMEGEYLDSKRRMEFMETHCKGVLFRIRPQTQIKKGGK